MPRGRFRAALLAASATVFLGLAPAAAEAHHDQGNRGHGQGHGGRGGPYRQTNLVSDVPGAAQVTDPSLVNAWGMSAGPTTPVWVSDNGTDSATLYSGATHKTPVAKVPLTVSIPGGEPTGQVFNPTDGFVVASGMDMGPARFIFASESGNITGWNPGVPMPATSTQAQPAVHTADAVYKGLALAQSGGNTYLYAADFHHGKIDVFDSKFMPATLSGDFTDPNIPAGFAPFNVQAIGSVLFVTYAKQDADAHDDVAGPGNGFVDAFTTDGHLIRRVVSGGALNSPWGLALAPSGFGAFSHALLVGNFGDGAINAYSPFSGRFLGRLRGKNGPITIDGLWGLRFGNGTAGDPRTLLFTAGPDGEAHGLFGSIGVGRH
jgi:uncharacterized protein (TIGR03118 family)